jgi:hypothetical protein
MLQALSDVPTLPSGPWQAIGQVTSVLTLVAFSVAALAGVVRAYLKSKEKQLLAAPEEQRPALIQALNDSFLVAAVPIDTGRLTRDQAFSLLLQQVHDRSRRFSVMARLIAFIALLAAATTAFAYSRTKGPGPHPPPDFSSDSAAQRAFLVSTLSDAYAYSGRLSTFLDSWMQPPALETARVADGSISFTGPQGSVATSIDTTLMPVVTLHAEYVSRAKLTSIQASHIAAFLTTYAQLKGALNLVKAAPPTALRGSLLDAASAAREAARRGARAVCTMADSLPTLIRAFPVKNDALSPCPPT